MPVRWPSHRGRDIALRRWQEGRVSYRGRAKLDLVGVGRWPRARHITFVGSVKWRDRAPFGHRDLEALARQHAILNGAIDAPMIAVSRSGSRVDSLAVTLGPEDLLSAWRRHVS